MQVFSELIILTASRTLLGERMSAPLAGRQATLHCPAGRPGQSA